MRFRSKMPLLFWIGLGYSSIGFLGGLAVTVYAIMTVDDGKGEEYEGYYDD